VGSAKFGEVLYEAISGDHAGARIPHIHAYIGSGEAIIELDNGVVRLSLAHGAPIRGNLKKSELRRIIVGAVDNYDALLELWRVSQPQ
jgi:hypothetical protein